MSMEIPVTRAGPAAAPHRGGVGVRMTGQAYRWARRMGLALVLMPGLTPIALAEVERIRVGVYDNPPKVFLGDDGEPTGFWPELTRAIAASEGWRIEWVHGTWDESLARLEDDRIDVMVDTAVTGARREYFAFGEQTVHVSWSQVYAARGVRIEIIPDLAGKRIGALARSINLEGPEGLRTLLDQFAVGAQVVAMPDYAAIFAALDRGELDAGVTNRDFGNRAQSGFDLTRTPILFQPADLRYAFARGNPDVRELMARFDARVAALKQDPNSVYHALQARWLGIERGPAREVLPAWLAWVLWSLLGVTVLLTASIAVVEMRVRARTRTMREQQARLQRHEQMLAESQRIAHVGSWRLDLGLQRLEWSQETYRIVGVSPGEFTPTVEGFFSYVHPEDRAALEVVRNPALKGLRPYDVAFRIVRPDGEVRDVQERAEAELDGSGNALYLSGTLQDITERKRSERETERLARGLRTTLESITDAFYTLDPDWRFKYINAAGERLLERRGDALIGRSVWDEFPEAVGTPIEHEYRRAVAQRVTVELHEYYAPLGKWFDIRAYPSEEGLAVYFLDVTEHHAMLARLQAQEETLRRSRDHLAELLESRRALINSLPAHIALLDRTATILDVNEQWRQFGAQNAFAGADLGVGMNYLSVCDGASGEGADEAAKVAQGLRDVLAGRRKVFALEYSCHSPEHLRWFRVTVNSLVPGEALGEHHGAVVMHLDITERKLAEQELNRLAYHDPLTDLPSRTGFTLYLAEQVRRAGWQPGAIVVMVDIVGMRDINDAHGYETGDQLLIRIGGRLREQAGEEGLAGRTGGDEFVLLLAPDPARSPEQALHALSAALCEPIVVAGVELEIGIRVGCTYLAERPRAAESLLREAELALFQNRVEPGLPWVAYTPELDRVTHQRIEFTRELRKALDEQQFEMHFQPKVDLRSGRILGCEALLRWNHPQRGLQSPGLFIPIAEKSQLIAPIGDWILRDTCRQIRQWRDTGLQVVPVSINVSLVQFLSGDFPRTVQRALSEFGLAPDALSLEITESVFERVSDSLLAQLRELNELGVRLSLDDFGTGYSSLLYLQKYPFDEIKIDQGFVRHILEDTYSREIVRMVMGLARAFRAEVVAEGIESVEVRDALLALGCRIGQGYHYSVPLAARPFSRLLDGSTRLPLADAER